MTTSIKADSGGFEAGKFRPDGLDLILGNTHADVLQSLLLSRSSGTLAHWLHVSEA